MTEQTEGKFDESTLNEDEQKLVAAVRTVVEREGRDFTADRCQYLTEDGRPYCIAGQALVEFGIPAPALSIWEGQAVHMIIDGLPELQNIGPRVKWALQDAQGSQDNGPLVPYSDPRRFDRSWGMALEQFENTLHVQVPRRQRSAYLGTL